MGRSRSVLLPLVALAIVLAGATACDPATGAPQAVPTSAPGSSVPDGPVDYERAATSPVVVISAVDATVAGVQGVRTTVLYGDGTLLRPRSSGDGWTRSRVAAGVIDRILLHASSAGLLGDKRLAEPGVSDMGSTTVSITANGHSRHHRVYAPGYEGGLTRPEVEGRRQVLAFGESVNELGGSDLVEAPAPYRVERTLVMIAPSSGPVGETVPGRWPSLVPLRETFGANGCAVLSGEKAEAITALTGPSDGQQSGPVLADTGLQLAPTVEVRSYPLLPHQDGCAAAVPAGQLPAPWPGADRRPADAWSTWIAAHIVAEAGAHNRIGGVRLDATELSWFTLNSTAVTVDRITMIDVVGTRAHGKTASGMSEFAIRFDPATGRISKISSR